MTESQYSWDDLVRNGFRNGLWTGACYTSRQMLGSALASRSVIEAAFPGYQLEAEDMVAEGDKVAVSPRRRG